MRSNPCADIGGNMKELAITKIKNEQIKGLITRFYESIQDSLGVKDTSRNKFFALFSDSDLRSILKNKEILQFKDFNSFIKNLQGLKPETYQNTTYWKVLTFLPPIKTNLSQLDQLYSALNYLNASKFLGENNFSVINVASIIYSLAQSDPLGAADMLVVLNRYQLLTEENLGKINSNDKLNSKLFTKILEKLSVPDGTNPILTQANLDKLLQNPELDLEVLGKLLKAEDESKILTQEKFDLAISLKNLLTLENVNQIEKIKLDCAKITDLFRVFAEANILTQENFDRIVQLSEPNFKTSYKALSLLFNEKQDGNCLSQENVEKILGEAAFDIEKLAKIFSLLRETSILTIDDFKILIGLSKDEFEKNIFPVIVMLHQIKLLNQDNFIAFFEVYYDACIFDEENGHRTISQLDLDNFFKQHFKKNYDALKSSIQSNNRLPSMAEKLCSTLVDFFSRVTTVQLQAFFKDILNYFNEEIQTNKTPDRSKPDETTKQRVTEHANAFFTASNTPENAGDTASKTNVAPMINVH